MTLASFLNTIRPRFADCLTKSYQERQCRMTLGSFNADSLFTIHGSKYQNARRFRGKLADRTIVSAQRGGFVCVIELKGGSISSVSDVVDQVRGGLGLAEEVLIGQTIRDWFPVVLHGRQLSREQVREFNLARNRVTFRNESPKRLEYKRCGTSLDDLLD